MMLDKQQRLSLLTELIKLAKADHEVREVEFAFLSNVAELLLVDESEFRALFEEYIEFNPPELEADRIVQFHRMVLLMNVDLETSPEEINHIKNIGIRMGLNPRATDTVLEEMLNYENKIVPPDRLLDIFKTFHN